MGNQRHDGRDRLRCSGDDGGNLIEYSLLIALIALVCISAASFFAEATSDKMVCSGSAIIAAGDNSANAPTNC